jgi:hypothetical protein
MLPIDDPSGANQTFTVTVAAGIAGKTGTAVLYVAGERIEVAVAATDDEADVAANLAAAVGEGYVKVGRPLISGYGQRRDQRCHADRAAQGNAGRQDLDREEPGWR